MTTRTLTAERLASIEAVLADTLLKRSFQTYMGVEGWEWRALIEAARAGLSKPRIHMGQTIAECVCVYPAECEELNRCIAELVSKDKP